MSSPIAMSLKAIYPWIKLPLIIAAPMRLISGPPLAMAVSNAGGIGFIAPGKDPQALKRALSATKELASSAKFAGLKASSGNSEILPIGLGVLVFDCDLASTKDLVRESPPAIVWLFAPKSGQTELDRWSHEIREVSPKTQIWIQVGSVLEAKSAVTSTELPDVLVVQGSDAGGHGLVKGASLMSLLPEVMDMLRKSKLSKEMPVMAAGGIADGRGVTASLALGAVGSVLGTRFLAAKETDIAPGYQQSVIDAVDGGQNTVRTQLYDELRGTNAWPAIYDGRAIVNKSYLDDKGGLHLEKNRAEYKLAVDSGAWGTEGRLTMYVGASVGLVNEVQDAKSIVEETREQAVRLLSDLSGKLP